MKSKFETTRLVLQELFYVLFGALFIFSIMELIWPKIIIAYFNLNWILIVWLFVGIVLLILSQKLNNYE